MNPARKAVVKVLAKQAASVRTMPPLSVETAALDPRDRRLAVAIHRTVLQRWLTLESLLDAHLKKPLASLEPILQAVLLSGAAQLVFMDKVPPHAAVDESVEIAKNRLRRGAASLANAVLRKLVDVADQRVPDDGWIPARDRIPVEPPGDGYIRLSAELLPPLEPFNAHLAAATSHPVELIDAWRQRFGDQTTRDLLLHDLTHPPTIVHAPGVDAASVRGEAHAAAGFIVWHDDHAALEKFIAGAPDRWVQDPASAEPMRATAELTPSVIIDACAGRGTKTRQLALLHPDATVVATDIDEHRRADLRAAFAGHDRVSAVAPHELEEYVGRCDLLVLDVPCSNTGTIARRPESRYRYSAATLESLVRIQRDIVEQHAPLLADGGAVLYSTCSIEPIENDEQAAWIADRLGRRVRSRRTILPGGADATYHDGSYHALIA